MSAPWAVIQHVPHEGPGLVLDVLRAAGQRVEFCHPYAGDIVPAAEDLAGLVILGGPMGATDDADYPQLTAERRLLEHCVAREVPVLAVCLGAQLLAAALGARVFTGPWPEVGLGTVALTPDGRADPVFGPAGHLLPVLHWHHDTFELPPGATLLASSETYPHQAFRIANSYALQFHVEIDERRLPGIEPHLPPGAHIDVRHLALVTRAGRALVERFVAGCLPGAHAEAAG